MKKRPHQEVLELSNQRVRKHLPKFFILLIAIFSLPHIPMDVRAGLIMLAAAIFCLIYWDWSPVDRRTVKKNNKTWMVDVWALPMTIAISMAAPMLFCAVIQLFRA
ncbi:MAG: hypothetical protein RL095_273 [Verrucomicrobiota bacterium]|jgi:hypothetical protein